MLQLGRLHSSQLTEHPIFFFFFFGALERKTISAGKGLIWAVSVMAYLLVHK